MESVKCVVRKWTVGFSFRERRSVAKPTKGMGVEWKYFAWLRRDWCLIVITVGIGLDWLPTVMASENAPEMGQWSGTKLLVLPGLFWALIAKPGWISRPHAIGLGYMVALAIGGGMGLAAGNVQMWRFVAIGVNGLILMYFLSVKSIQSVREVLGISVGLSALIPVVQWMTRLGLMAPENIEKGPDFERVFSIFDTTTVGFAPLLIAASIGGLVFCGSRSSVGIWRTLAACSLVAFGLTGALLAAQRSGVMAYGATLFAALVIFAVIRRKGVRSLVALVVLLGGIAFLAQDFFNDLSSSLGARFSDAVAFDDAVDLRLSGLMTFVTDLRNPLDLVPKGSDSLFLRTGVFPHLLLSEAYYEGGPIFLAIILGILARFMVACWRLVRCREEDARGVGMCLCSFAVGMAVQVSIQTALVLRLLPLVLGVGIAADEIVLRRRNGMRATSAGIATSGKIQ
jgi:hypothetical protein